MDYDETQQKRILREMERDLLALVAVDLTTGDFEVIYTDGAYRDYGNRFRGQDFFGWWQLGRMVGELLRDAWFEELGIDAERLSADERVQVEFIFAGLVAVLGSAEVATSLYVMTRLASSSVGQASIETLRSMASVQAAGAE